MISRKKQENYAWKIFIGLICIWAMIIGFQVMLWISKYILIGAILAAICFLVMRINNKKPKGNA